MSPFPPSPSREGEGRVRVPCIPLSLKREGRRQRRTQDMRQSRGAGTVRLPDFLSPAPISFPHMAVVRSIGMALTTPWFQQQSASVTLPLEAFARKTQEGKDQDR
jgi:hypothetical protein